MNNHVSYSKRSKQLKRKHLPDEKFEVVNNDNAEIQL